MISKAIAKTTQAFCLAAMIGFSCEHGLQGAMKCMFMALPFFVATLHLEDK